MHLARRFSLTSHLSASQLEKLASVLLALILIAIGFGAKGGLLLKRITWVEIIITISSTLFCGFAIIARPQTSKKIGVCATLFLSLAALIFISTTWSIEPSNSWLEANRTLAYALVFCAVVLASQRFEASWKVVLRAVVLTSITFTVFALLTKVFPEKLARDAEYARLREPFDYWNAIGIMAGLGIPSFLWLGARRTGHGAMNGLAYPGLFLSLLTVLLSYSRGALFAIFITTILWFIVTPRRLRGFAVLFVGSLSAFLVARWAFAQIGLTQDRVPLELRAAAGHQLGVLILGVVFVTAIIGFIVEFAMTGRRLKPETRRTLGIIVLVFVACIPIATAIGLTFTQRGLDGTVRYTWSSVTDPNARQPANTPGRFTEAGGVRARYWDEALKVFRESKLVGTGGGTYVIARLHYQKLKIVVVHAHSFVFQTLADLGLIGLGIVLAFLSSWLASFVKASGMLKRFRAPPDENQRVGILSLGVIAITFGIHSAVDWTWYEPSIALSSLLCAGCVAGYGLKTRKEPSHSATEHSTRRPKVIHLVTASGVVIFGFMAAWTFWQPLRSFEIGQNALQLNERGNYSQAVSQAKKAKKLNPLSIEPLFEIAAIEQGHGNVNGARKALEAAVKSQPANVKAWLQLGMFELTAGGQPQRAAAIAQIAIYLDPQSIEPITLFTQTQTLPQQQTSQLQEQQLQEQQPSPNGTSPLLPGSQTGNKSK